MPAGMTPPKIPPPAKSTPAYPKPAATVGRNAGFKAKPPAPTVKANHPKGPQLRHNVPKAQPAPRTGVDPNSIQGIVQALLAPQLAQYGQQSRDLASRQQAQQDAWRSLTSELDARLAGIPGQIQGDYTNAIHTTAGLGQEGLAALNAANPNASEQANLQAIGAPQSQMDAQTAQNQAVFGGGGGVLNYLGGVLPGQTLAQQELGKLFAARQLPEIQALQAKQALAVLLSGQGKDSADLQSQIADARAKATSQAYTIKGQAASAKAKNDSLNERVREFNLNYNLSVGKAANASLGYSKTITRADGSVVGVRKDGSTAVLLPAGSVGQPYRGGSWSTKVLADGSVIQTNSRTGQITQVKPPGSVLAPGKGKGPKSLTNAQLAKANQWLDTARKYGHYAHVDDPTKPIPTKEINAMAAKAGMTPSQFLGKSKAAADARFKAGIGTVAVRQHDDNYIQNLYLALVRDFQVPKKQAFDMVAKRFPQWGQSHKDWFPNPSQAGGAGFNTASKVITTAKQFLGTAYHYGGASPQTGFDCSGLLTYAFGKQGINLPHNAAEQFHMGKPVAPGNLKAGDAVFFVTDGTPQNPGHVAIYLGNGKVLVAPHTGAVVRIQDLASFGDYVGARRYT